MGRRHRIRRKVRLRDAGIPTAICGNIGRPLTGEVEAITGDHAVVLEVSSTGKSEPDDAGPVDGTAEAPNEKPNDKGAKTEDQGPEKVEPEKQDTDP